jgi:hypothetical protein
VGGSGIHTALKNGGSSIGGSSSALSLSLELEGSYLSSPISSSSSGSGSMVGGGGSSDGVNAMNDVWSLLLPLVGPAAPTLLHLSYAQDDETGSGSGSGSGSSGEPKVLIQFLPPLWTGTSFIILF